VPRVAALKHAPRCRPRIAASASAAPPSSEVEDVNALRHALVDALVGLNRGLTLDPDSETETPAEALVEDLAERLEDANICAEPTRSPLMTGSWELAYTSSTIARFHGGLSGLQKYVEGDVGRIIQVIDLEDGTCVFSEQISYVMPIVKKPASVTVLVSGKIRAVSETRQMWTPETIKASWFQLWAESWKSVRAFTIAETTYLDKQIRITRGQTGSLSIFARTQ
jgi:PAP_fibrillin